MSAFPNDPIILLSFINMKLRDSGDSLNEICKSANIDTDLIIKKLSLIGYSYSPAKNAFIVSKS